MFIFPVTKTVYVNFPCDFLSNFQWFWLLFRANFGVALQKLCADKKKQKKIEASALYRHSFCCEQQNEVETLKLKQRSYFEDKEREK